MPNIKEATNNLMTNYATPAAALLFLASGITFFILLCINPEAALLLN